MREQSKGFSWSKSPYINEERVSIIPSSIFSDQPFSKCKERMRGMFPPSTEAQNHCTNHKRGSSQWQETETPSLEGSSDKHLLSRHHRFYASNGWEKLKKINHGNKLLQNILWIWRMRFGGKKEREKVLWSKWTRIPKIRLKKILPDRPDMGRLPGTPQLPALPRTVSRTNQPWGASLSTHSGVFLLENFYYLPSSGHWDEKLPPRQESTRQGRSSCCPEGLSTHPHIARAILWAAIIWFKAAEPRLEQKLTSPSLCLQLPSRTLWMAFSPMSKKTVTWAIFPNMPPWREMPQGYSVPLQLATTAMQYTRITGAHFWLLHLRKRPQKIITVFTLWSLGMNPLLLSSAQAMFILSTALYKRPAFTLPEKCQEKSF